MNEQRAGVQWDQLTRLVHHYPIMAKDSRTIASMRELERQKLAVRTQDGRHFIPTAAGIQRFTHGPMAGDGGS